MRIHPFIPATIALLLGAQPAPAQQTQRHAFPEYGFSVEVPSRWAQMPEQLVAAFDSSMSRREPADIRSVAGFQMVSSPNRLAPPFVVVRVQRLAPITREELAAAAMAPSRLLALREWLTYMEEAYGRSYSLTDFTWNDRDGIFWMAGSGAEDPYPEVASITGAIPFEGFFVLVAYRTFPSSDLKLVRDTIRDVLLSVRALGGERPGPEPARGRWQERPEPSTTRTSRS